MQCLNLRTRNQNALTFSGNVCGGVTYEGAAGEWTLRSKDTFSNITNHQEDISILRSCFGK